MTRPALRYRGGKWRIAPWIISHFPPHECYVEPFMGACSVLLQKASSDFEVVNDLDGDIVAFFRVLRDRPEELQRSIALTPYSRQEYRECKDHALDDLERARRLYGRCWMGRGSSTSDGGWRFQKEWNGWRMNITRLFHELGHLGDIAARLSSIQIDQGPALDVIGRFDAPTTLFYCDPPYLWGTRTRGSRNLYRSEMNDSDHEHLANILHGIQGMAVVSGYHSELYDDLYAGWRCETKMVYAESQKAKTEVLWISPAAEAARLGGGVQQTLL